MKRAIPTVKAEALEKGKFELTFLRYATYRNPHQPGIATMVEVAPIPNGSLFRFSTFLEGDDGSEIVGVNYKTVMGIHPCDSPLDERRVFLYKGDMEELLATGDAEYLDIPETPKEQLEAEEEMLNEEIEAKLADMSDEADDEPEDASTEESDEEFDSDADDKEESEDDNHGGFDFDETQEEDDDSDKEEDSSDDESDGAVDVSDMSPEQIRDMLNNHYNGNDEPEEEKAEEPKKEEPEKESKQNGSFIGAPADLSSHKEPYKGKKESKYDKKRDWENKNRDNRKNDKRDKKDKKFDKKKARRDAIAEAGEIDFAAIARGAFE